MTFTLQTATPFAVDSEDHLHPWGAANDDTHHPAFVRACEGVCGATQLSVLDIGCAGGGLVADFIEAGHVAVGIDGAEAAKRGNWLKYPGNFFHCDASHPFKIWNEDYPPGYYRGEPILYHSPQVEFDVVCAWEFMEHIPEDRISVVLENIARHLCPAGIFVASISTKPDVVNGHVYHQTVQPEPWWKQRFAAAGFEVIASPFQIGDYPRTDPCSFHLVAKIYEPLSEETT